MSKQPESKPLPKSSKKSLITVEGTKIMSGSSSKTMKVPSTVVKR